jgi:tetratricopeptide (TPR) repeat protein
MDLAMNVDASLVVHGSFEVMPAAGGSGSAGFIKMRAEVLDVRRLRRGPAEEQAGPMEDLSLLQNRLAWRLLKAVRPGLEILEEQFLESHPPIRLDALESYVRGLLAPTLDQKLALFANAARLEPVFSQPCFQLGRLHFERKDYRAAADWLARVLPSDSSHREALFLAGLTRYHLADFAAAREAFRQVAAQAPIGPVLNNLGVAQFRASDSEAAATLRQAIENDEADPDYHFNLAYVLWRRGEFAAAAASLRAVLERTPEDETAALLLTRCEQGSGPRPGEPRLENLERLKTVFDDSAWRHLQAILGPEAAPR